MNNIKLSMNGQIEKSKEAMKIINDVQEFFRKLDDDVKNEFESIVSYQKKLNDDIKNAEIEKTNLEKQYEMKNKNIDQIKSKTINIDKEKSQIIEEIKKVFESLNTEQINYLKLRQEKNEV